MKFCPKCETRMRSKFEEGVVICPKCGLSVDRQENEPLNEEKKLMSSQKSMLESSLKVMDAENDPYTLPTTNIECSHCGNNTAFWWMLQTRSADEATTQFYRCTKCNHTWRNYA